MPEYREKPVSARDLKRHADRRLDDVLGLVSGDAGPRPGGARAVDMGGLEDQLGLVAEPPGDGAGQRPAAFRILGIDIVAALAVLEQVDPAGQSDAADLVRQPREGGAKAGVDPI